MRKRVGPSRWPLRVLALATTFFILLSMGQAQGAKQTGVEVPISDRDADHVKERNEWTVTAGQTSGAYALRVLPVGSSFNGAVSLTCSAGLPAGAQCVFNPSTPVTPGNSAVDVVMNISTRASSGHLEVPVKGNFPPPAMWIPLAAIVFGVSVSGNRTPRQFQRLSGCVIFCLMMMAFVSCAGVSNGGGGGGQPPPPVNYHITVTGTSSGTPPDAGQSVTVALVVN